MTQVEAGLSDLAFQAESGDAGAQFRLGVLFLLGESVEQDLEAAYQWLARAAEGQYPGASLLAAKLAHCRTKANDGKRPVRVRPRVWMKTASAAVVRLCQNARRSVKTVRLQLSFLRVWKSMRIATAKNLIARVRFQPGSEDAKLPARRRDGFQFRDSL